MLAPASDSPAAEQLIGEYLRARAELIDVNESTDHPQQHIDRVVGRFDAAEFALAGVVLVNGGYPGPGEATAMILGGFRVIVARSLEPDDGKDQLRLHIMKVPS